MLVAAGLSGRPAYLLEKDVWVVQLLHALFATQFTDDLTFKGGTSLSKAYRAIRRFSEDIDITYDIRAIIPELVADADEAALPPTRSQERSWSRQIRRRLASWVSDEVKPAIESELLQAGLSTRLVSDGDKLTVAYEPLFPDYGFVRAEVLLEFGARSTGEPRDQRTVECDASPYIPDVDFPSARPWVMSVYRTFWEKATAIHVFCHQRRDWAQRLSRHWNDVVRLNEAGYADKALEDRSEALSVARHKRMFFRERDTHGNWIDYEAAVNGNLQLVPEGNAYSALRSDYERMMNDGILLDDGEGFDDLMKKCAELEERANSFFPRD